MEAINDNLVPVILNVLMFAGLGQLCQRRIVAGSVFILLGVVCNASAFWMLFFPDANVSGFPIWLTVMGTLEVLNRAIASVDAALWRRDS